MRCGYVVGLVIGLMAWAVVGSPDGVEGGSSTGKGEEAPLEEFFEEVLAVDKLVWGPGARVGGMDQAGRLRQVMEALETINGVPDNGPPRIGGPLDFDGTGVGGGGLPGIGPRPTAR